MGMISTLGIDQNMIVLDIVSLLSVGVLLGVSALSLTAVFIPSAKFELYVAGAVTILFLQISFVGLSLNFLSSLTKTPMLSHSPTISVTIISAIFMYLYSRKKTQLPTQFKTHDNLVKIMLIGCLFILTTTIFSWYLKFNYPLLQTAILYSGIIMLSLIGSSQRVDRIETGAIIFIVALSLILHNELALPILGAGDSEKTFYVSNIVLAQSVWPVDIPQSKFSVLSIVVFHPVLTLITPLSLESMYRIIYPILFSILPAMLFYIYQRSFTKRVSYWGALLVVFLHPFYTTFALNTRTGYTLLFVSLLLVFYTSSQQQTSGQRILEIGILFLIATGYYATGPIFICVFGVTMIAQSVDHWLRGSSVDPIFKIRLNDISILSIMTVAWLIYTTQSYTFSLVTGVLKGTVREVLEGTGDLSDSAGGSAFTQEFSYTYELITQIYIGLTILILISLLFITYFRYFRSSEHLFGGQYYPFFVGGGLVFIAAFAPTSSIGIARLYTIGLIFLTTAAFFMIYYTASRVDERISYLAPAIMIFILLVNTGFVGMVVGDSRITQSHLTHEESGGPHDYQASGWAIEFKKSGSTIYGSGDWDRLLGHLFVTEYESGVPGGYSLLQSQNQSGLIYLSARSVEDETVSSKMWYGGGLATEREYIGYEVFAIDETNLVYSTGKSEVRYRH